jgi:hypothetical protein
VTLRVAEAGGPRRSGRQRQFLAGNSAGPRRLTVTTAGRTGPRRSRTIPAFWRDRAGRRRCHTAGWRPCRRWRHTSASTSSSSARGRSPRRPGSASSRAWPSRGPRSALSAPAPRPARPDRQLSASRGRANATWNITFRARPTRSAKPPIIQARGPRSEHSEPQPGEARLTGRTPESSRTRGAGFRLGNRRLRLVEVAPRADDLPHQEFPHSPLSSQRLASYSASPPSIAHRPRKVKPDRRRWNGVNSSLRRFLGPS